MKKFALILIICLLLCGCSTNSPKGVTEQYIKNLKNSLTEKFRENTDGSSVYTRDIQKLLNDFEYKVSDEKIDGDRATVLVHVKTYDLGNMMKDILTDYMKEIFSLIYQPGYSEDKVNELIKNIVAERAEETKKKGKTCESDVTVYLYKDAEGKWEIDEGKSGLSLMGAITGGILENLGGFGFGGLSSESYS